MKTLLPLLVLALAAPVARAQIRLGEAPPVGVPENGLSFSFGLDNGPDFFTAGEVRGRTVGKVRINGTVYTLARTRRVERGDWTTSTFSGSGITVEVRYRFGNAMGDEGGDCAHGNGTLTVRRAGQRVQRDVNAAACPGYLGQ